MDEKVVFFVKKSDQKGAKQRTNEPLDMRWQVLVKITTPAPKRSSSKF